MLRNILVATLILSQLSAFAQKKTPPRELTAAPAEKINYELVGSPMPSLLLISMDTVLPVVETKKSKKQPKPAYVVSHYNTKMYTDQDFNSKGNLLVMMFNPTCGHCEDMTEQFIKNKGWFKSSKLILLANSGMRSYLPNFVNNHRIKEQADFMVLGTDSTDFIKNTFLYQALPQINIYNADRKLVKTYTGTVSMDSLKQYIQ